MDRLSSAVDELAATAADMRQSLELCLAQMKTLPNFHVDKTPGWMAKYQVRCCGCGRFATVLHGSDGYNPHTGEYDPWWRVACKRCGEGEGYVPE
ncbi:hypothetical protein SEA_CECE_55 [Microbacterium phage Cece]|nr:hypothetical protein SEA_CECE_55 [Microbacterium phage Cece]